MHVLVVISSRHKFRIGCKMSIDEAVQSYCEIRGNYRAGKALSHNWEDTEKGIKKAYEALSAFKEYFDSIFCDERENGCIQILDSIDPRLPVPFFDETPHKRSLYLPRSSRYAAGERASEVYSRIQMFAFLNEYAGDLQKSMAELITSKNKEKNRVIAIRHREEAVRHYLISARMRYESENGEPAFPLAKAAEQLSIIGFENKRQELLERSYWAYRAAAEASATSPCSSLKRFCINIGHAGTISSAIALKDESWEWGARSILSNYFFLNRADDVFMESESDNLRSRKDREMIRCARHINRLANKGNEAGAAAGAVIKSMTGTDVFEKVTQLSPKVLIEYARDLSLQSLDQAINTPDLFDLETANDMLWFASLHYEGRDITCYSKIKLLEAMTAEILAHHSESVLWAETAIASHKIFFKFAKKKNNRKKKNIRIYSEMAEQGIIRMRELQADEIRRMISCMPEADRG